MDPAKWETMWNEIKGEYEEQKDRRRAIHRELSALMCERSKKFAREQQPTFQANCDGRTLVCFHCSHTVDRIMDIIDDSRRVRDTGDR